MLSQVEHIERLVGWSVAYDCARATQGKLPIHKEPSDDWKRKMMLAPHSPIRAVQYLIYLRCPYYVSVHLVRHHEGIEKYVGSQRNDRQDKYDRRAARQDEPVLFAFIVNADALRFISRRRLCNKADPATRQAWNAVVSAVSNLDPIVGAYCQPECFWTGFQCPELQPCGKCPAMKHPQIL